MRTPQAVKDAAKSLTEQYGTKFSHLGQYNGYEVFSVRLLTLVPTGFPWVFLYKEGEEVLPVCGFEVFDIMDEAVRNTKERRKAARQAKNNQDK